MNKPEILQRVAQECHNRLWDDEEKLSYLKERGISHETISRFMLGSFPSDLRHLFKVVPAGDLRSAGVIKNATKSMFRTWNLLIPVADVWGKTVALAGRTLMPTEKREKRGLQKYVNTIYTKSHHLFGLYLAKRAIAESGTAHVVEGYMEILAAHQAGMDNVVASCGTAFSNRQLALLARYAERIVFLYDNDEPGQKAAARHVESKQCPEVSVSAVNPFPPANDLDEFLQSRTVGELKRIMGHGGNGYEHVVAPSW